MLKIEFDATILFEYQAMLQMIGAKAFKTIKKMNYLLSSKQHKREVKAKNG